MALGTGGETNETHFFVPPSGFVGGSVIHHVFPSADYPIFKDVPFSGTVSSFGSLAVPRIIDTIPRDDSVECRDTDHAAAIKRRVEADFEAGHAARLGRKFPAVDGSFNLVAG
jgi:hypothetical protein